MNNRYEIYKSAVEEMLAGKYLPAGDGTDGLAEAMRYSLLAGGKRIRPVLCLEFARICGADPMRVLPAACGIEMLHTYSLIHDDLPCMDDDDERRGMLSSHKRFGETTAVLAGDCLQAEAFSMICEAQIGEEQIGRCCRILARAAGFSGVCGGQYMDLLGTNDSADALSAVELRKTAALMGASCAVGAAAAGADDTAVDAADAFGMALGMAFQCRDDLLDGDGFCALLGRERCTELAGMYTDEAVRLLQSFSDTAFLEELAFALGGRQA